MPISENYSTENVRASFLRYGVPTPAVVRPAGARRRAAASAYFHFRVPPGCDAPAGRAAGRLVYCGLPDGALACRLILGFTGPFLGLASADPSEVVEATRGRVVPLPAGWNPAAAGAPGLRPNVTKKFAKSLGKSSCRRAAHRDHENGKPGADGEAYSTYFQSSAEKTDWRIIHRTIDKPAKLLIGPEWTRWLRSYGARRDTRTHLPRPRRPGRRS
jgi:hypothetical protein